MKTMEIYVKKGDKLVSITLYDLFIDALNKSNENFDSGTLGDGSCNWICIEQDRDKYQLSISINFEDDGNTLEEVTVHKTPIKTIVDSENMEKL
jgi:hypothetical protein